METLASAMRRDNRRFKASSSSTTSSSAGRIPLVMAFLSCLAWLYVAGRLWQDAQTRAILSGLLEKSSGNLPKAVSVDDKLRNLGCTEIGRKIAEAEMDLTKAKSEGYLWGNGTGTTASDKKKLLGNTTCRLRDVTPPSTPQSPMLSKIRLSLAAASSTPTHGACEDEAGRHPSGQPMAPVRMMAGRPAAVAHVTSHEAAAEPPASHEVAAEPPRSRWRPTTDLTSTWTTRT
ncbi:uncharacterized protein [Lolium perenne]|uniref:uncharacterized protein n=1 Tax=Lolium perenne TaxID=4522 RepID=UPI0021F6182F|nr:hydroxyproline O-galactosyltransferase HPGT3-like [Lolium perenne]